MKKLQIRRKGAVHPSSSSSSSPILSDHLSSAILNLTAALSPQDKEVLAYLISSPNDKNNFISPQNSTLGRGGRMTPHEHPLSFNCDCFRCYIYWIRWDSSPNRQLIHEAIDALELDAVQPQPKAYNKNKKDRKRRQLGNTSFADEINKHSLEKLGEPVEEKISSTRDCGEGDDIAAGGSLSVRRLASFFGERIQGVRFRLIH